MSEMDQIFVFENRPRWVPELKRQFLDESVAVRVSQSLQDLTRNSERSHECLLALVLDRNANAVLNLLKFRNAHRWEHPVIIIAGKQWMSLEWSLREAGIFAFASERISGSELSNLCRCALAD